MTEKTQKSLSEEQNRILEISSGAWLVLAPPGTGKTEVLSRRVIQAVETDAAKNGMACLTFTNRAAAGMIQRIPEHCRDKVFVGNFHAFALRFLESRSLIAEGSSVMDEEDAREMMAEAVVQSAFDKSPWAEKATPGFLLEFNLLLGLMRFEMGSTLLELSRRPVENRFYRLFQNPKHHAEIKVSMKQACDCYQHLKIVNRCLDFDDLLLLTLTALTRQDVESPGHRYGWIQVDEAQDLNSLQWAILEQIREEDATIVLYGDFEQSIFSFIGAAPKLLYEKMSEYEILELDTNYRSPPDLLSLYRDYAAEHLGAEHSAGWKANSRSMEDGGGLYWVDHEGESGDELECLAKEVLPDLLAEAKGGVALLVRYNKTADEIVSFMDSAGLEAFKVSGFDLFSREAARDVMAFFAVLADPCQREPWRRLVKMFSAARSLKEARKIVTKVFERGLMMDDLLREPGAKGPVQKLAAAMGSGRVVVFDTETTGLRPGVSEIIQIAAVEVVNGDPRERFNEYIRPDGPVGREAMKVHKLTDEFLAEKGRDAAGVLSRFKDFVGDSPLIAHNLHFDWSMVQADCRRKGVEPFSDHHERLDSLKLSRRLFPAAPSYKLASLIEHLGLRGVNSHDALEDVLATVELLQRIYERAMARRDDNSAPPAWASQDLHDFCKNFAPLWRRWNSAREKLFNLSELYDDFFEEARRMGVKRDTVALEKFRRYLELRSPRAPLAQLLREEVPRLRLFKEADLLVGDERVIVATVHKAKGLEWDTVVIPSCVDGTFPSFMAKEKEDRDEEARILYVAMTRARRKLVISSHGINRFGKEVKVSSFLQPFLSRFSRIEKGE